MNQTPCNLWKLLGVEWKNQQRTEIPTILNASSGNMDITGSIDIQVRGDDGNPFTHCFLTVKQLPGIVYGIVGRDLQTKLGITVGNLPTGIVASAIEPERTPFDLRTSLAQVITDLESANKADSKYADFWHTYRLRIKENLSELMVINERLTGVCTHPAGVIKFATKDEEPVNVRQYELPFAHRPTVDKQINEWLQTGIIEKTTDLDHSNNPIMVVPKRDLEGRVKGWRVCVDPRMINQKIQDSTFPLPLAKDIFDSLEGNKVYSIIDLKSGFNQMEVLLADRKKTAFTWKGITYQFRGAPFGFTGRIASCASLY